MFVLAHCVEAEEEERASDAFSEAFDASGDSGASNDGQKRGRERHLPLLHVLYCTRVRHLGRTSRPTSEDHVEGHDG